MTKSETNRITFYQIKFFSENISSKVLVFSENVGFYQISHRSDEILNSSHVYYDQPICFASNWFKFQKVFSHINSKFNVQI